MILLAASLLGLAWWFGMNGPVRALEWLQALDQQQNLHNFVVIYLLICVASLCLVMPSGSLLLIAAGFSLGAIPAALLYALMQCLTCWPVFRLAQLGLLDSSRALRQLQETKLLRNLEREPFATSLVLRMTPVVPSAVACLAAAGLGLGFRPFLLATVLCCWIRPLLYASFGASLLTLANESGAGFPIGRAELALIAGLCLSSVGLLLYRLWARRSTAMHEN